MLKKNEFLNVGISAPTERKLTIQFINKKRVKLLNGKKVEKIILDCVEYETGLKFKISDVAHKESDGSIKISGIWWSITDGGLSPQCYLAKLLKKHKAALVGELRKKEVTAVQDSNNFLVLKGYD